jgi:hypothetical protein
VNRDAIEEGVGTREVDVFEDARTVRCLADLAELRDAVCTDPEHLASGEVAHDLVTGDVEHDRLTGDRVEDAFRRLFLAQDARLDAKGIAEGVETFLGHATDRVGALDLLEDLSDAGFDVVDVDLVCLTTHQRVGKHVEHDFEVAVATERDLALAKVGALQLVKIGDVAVVRHDDANRVIEPERLHVGVFTEADGRVAHVTDGQVAFQSLQVLVLKDLSNKAKALFGPELVFERDHAGSILPAVLDGHEAVDDVLDNVRFGRAED